jgi:hypothetical protein
MYHIKATLTGGFNNFTETVFIWVERSLNFFINDTFTKTAARFYIY